MFNETGGTVSYRWKADVKGFAMPVRVGNSSRWQIIEPSTEWKTMPTPLRPQEFNVATDLYYINVVKN